MKASDLTPGRVYALSRRGIRGKFPQPVLVLSNQRLEVSNDHKSGSIVIEPARKGETLVRSTRGVLVVNLDEKKMYEWCLSQPPRRPEAAQAVKRALTLSAAIREQLPLRPGARALLAKAVWPSQVVIVQSHMISRPYAEEVEFYQQELGEQDVVTRRRTAEFGQAHATVQNYVLASSLDISEFRAELRGADVVVPLGHFAALAAALAPGRGVSGS